MKVVNGKLYWGRQPRGIWIRQFNQDGEFIQAFKNRKECQDKLGISKSSLSNVISGRRKYWKGYYFIESNDKVLIEQERGRINDKEYVAYKDYEDAWYMLWS